MYVYKLCIDLGSNYTTIYKNGSGVVLREPSLVLIDTSSKLTKIIGFGHDAQKEYGRLSPSQVLVRPIIDGVIKNLDLTKKMVCYFLSKIVKFKLVKPNIDIIVCLPTSLNYSQYEEYRNVFYSIGFSKIDFVYNISIANLNDCSYFCIGKANLLVNIGAGKTEISTVINGKIINSCSLNVGGNLIDEKIVEYLAKTKNYSISLNTANKLKNEIGSLYETDKSSLEIFAQDLNSSTSNKVVIFSSDIYSPIFDCYLKIMQTIQVFLTNCSHEVAEDIKNDGIVVYGGGSQITGLEKFFKKTLNVCAYVVDSPERFAVCGCEKLFSNPSLLDKIIDEN